MQTKKPRHDIRLRLGKGVVFLRNRGIPAAACTLTDLSEGGCRCLMPIQKFDGETVARVKIYTQPGKQTAIDISAPPHLPGLHLDVAIKHASEIESGELELGLEFLNLEEEDREVIKTALQAFAIDKLESAPPPPSSTEERKTSLTETGTIRREQISAFSNPSFNPLPLPPAPPAAERDPRRETTTRMMVKSWFSPAPAASQNDPYRNKRIGEILKELGKIGDDQISEAYAATRSVGEKFGRYLLRSGWISPLDLCSALSLQSGLPIVDLAEVKVNPALAEKFSYLMMLRHEFIPFEESGENLLIATAHPLTKTSIADLEQRCGKKIKVFLGEDDLIMKALHALQPGKERKLRKQKRHKLSVPATYRFFNRQQSLYSEDSFTGRTVDVSETGIMIVTDEDIRKRGTCVQVRFALPPENFEAICSVRYVKENTSKDVDGAWLVGLQVMDMSPQYRSQLKEICVRASMWNLKDKKSK